MYGRLSLWDLIDSVLFDSYADCVFCLCRKPVPLLLDQDYVNLKNQIIKAERRVLKELGFCVHVKHPHKVGMRPSCHMSPLK